MQQHLETAVRRRAKTSENDVLCTGARTYITRTLRSKDNSILCCTTSVSQFITTVAIYNTQRARLYGFETNSMYTPPFPILNITLYYIILYVGNIL